MMMALLGERTTWCKLPLTSPSYPQYKRFYLQSCSTLCKKEACSVLRDMKRCSDSESSALSVAVVSVVVAVVVVVLALFRIFEM